jgi:signal transduction histidine kinase
MAKSAGIVLDYSNDSTVRLVVHDNGIGSEECKNGFGLTGIQERVQLFGGNVRIQTAPNQGFTLTVELSG